MRKNWRDYLVITEKADKNSFIIFEEDFTGTKNYDLIKAIFSNLDVAIEYAQEIFKKEPLYIAIYSDYVKGDYDYITVIK